jgi:hypothetical protein
MSGLGCATLWPKTTVTVAAAPSDVLACAAAEAKALGYHVVADSLHGAVTAEKSLPLSALGPDVTEFARKNVLAVSLAPGPASASTAITIRAESISVEQTRRGVTDAPLAASPAVRADADTLVARCQHAKSNSSLP